MKKLFILLFSLFFLSSPSVFADTISDFEIEGISIGDSLLDYMTEEEILEEIERTKDWYLHLKDPSKYSHISFNKGLNTYGSMTFFVKNNSANEYITDKNEKYTILFIRGFIEYNEDFDSCIVKRDEVVEVLSGMFPNAQKIENVFTSTTEPSGNSVVDDVTFMFDSKDRIVARCNNWDENYRSKRNWSEGLHIVIQPIEHYEWNTDYK